MSKKKHAGVDSGTVWIGDPCYLVNAVAEFYGHDPHAADGFWQHMIAKAEDLNHGEWDWYATEPIGEHQGVWLSRFGGDGTFPVTISFDSLGNVTAAAIGFTADPDEDDDSGC